MEQCSLVDILKAIADSKSHDIFRCIAKGSVESEVLKQKEGLSKKQYYFRTKQLLKVGLVLRFKGRFSLTNLGTVIYHAQLIMEAGINNYSFYFCNEALAICTLHATEMVSMEVSF